MHSLLASSLSPAVRALSSLFVSCLLAVMAVTVVVVS
jgi:hypothetical protein